MPSIRVCAAAIVTLLSLTPRVAWSQDEPPAETPALPPVAAPAPTPLPDPPLARVEADGADRHNEDRSIAGHQFLFPTTIESALVATYAGVRARLTFLDIPNLPTDFGPSSLEAVGFAQTVDLAVKLWGPVGIFATGIGSGLLGTNLPSIVYQGATYSYGYGGGIVVRLLRSESTGTQIAVRGTFGQTEGQVASLVPLFASPSAAVALQQIVQTGLGEVIRTPIHASAFHGTVALAQAFGPIFGVQASASVGYSTATSEPFDTAAGARRDITTNGATFRFGGAAALDFNSLELPIAVMGEYLLARESSASSLLSGNELDDVSRIVVGVFYSGRPNLQIGIGEGVELGLAKLSTRAGTSETPHQLFTQLTFRYIW